MPYACFIAYFNNLCNRWVLFFSFLSLEQQSLVAQRTSATNARKLHAVKQSVVPNKNGLPVTAATSGITCTCCSFSIKRGTKRGDGRHTLAFPVYFFKSCIFMMGLVILLWGKNYRGAPRAPNCSFWYVLRFLISILLRLQDAWTAYVRRTETKEERKRTRTTKRYTSNSLRLVEEVTPQILFLDIKPFVISTEEFFQGDAYF